MGRIVGEPRLARDRKRPKDGNYYIYWTDSDRGSMEVSLRTKDHGRATRKFQDWVLEQRGSSSIPRTEDVSVGSVLEFYAAVRRDDVSSPDRIDNAMKALLPYWAGKPVSAVNALSCQRYREFRQKVYAARWPDRRPLSPNTIRRELTVLSAALSLAKKEDLIDREVTVHRPREKPASVPYFTCREAVCMIRIAPRVKRASPYLRLFLLIGFLSGRRKEAILSLQWRDVDLDAGFIFWNPEHRVRTNKERPPSAIPRRLYKYLREHRARYPDDDFVISRRGQPIKDVKTAFAALMRVFRGVQGYEDATRGAAFGSRFSVADRAYPHLLRHSCATWQMQAGVKTRAAAEFLGMSEETLIRRYYHHHPEFQMEAANAF